MYNKKFENKTYSECAQNELSDVEIEPKSSAKDDNTINKEDSEKKNYLKTTFQPKCIFTNQNNNISFFQSTSSNSYKYSSKNKNKNLTASIDNKNKIKVNNNNNNKNLTNTPITKAQSFNFNYTALKRKSANQSTKKANNKNSQKINIDELDTKNKKPKRTIKSYKKQLNSR